MPCLTSDATINSTMRDVLRLTTVEMGMERWLAGRQQNNRELLNLR